MNKKVFEDLERGAHKDRKPNERLHSDEELLWRNLIQISSLEVNRLGDVHLRIDSFHEPLKEKLVQTYNYVAGLDDIFYIEVTLKSYNNFVTDVKNAYPSINEQDVKARELTFCIKAYSLVMKSWLKDYQPLNEVLKLLQRDGLLHTEVRNIY